MKKDIFRMTVKVGILFILITGIFTMTYYSNADLAKEMLEIYMPTLESIMEEDGSLSWVNLLQNNLFACVKTVGMGLVPLVYLPVWTLFANAVLMGAVFGLSAGLSGTSLISSLVFGILPHGIFELPALFLSMAMGLYLCRFLTKKLFRRAGEQSILEVLNGIAKAFVLIVLPLIVIASAMECYVTPEIMAWAGL